MPYLLSMLCIIKFFKNQKNLATNDCSDEPPCNFTVCDNKNATVMPLITGYRTSVLIGFHFRCGSSTKPMTFAFDTALTEQILSSCPTVDVLELYSSGGLRR